MSEASGSDERTTGDVISPAPQGSIRAASAVGFLYWTGWQGMVPFLALYATGLGASAAAVGAILGSYSILALVFSLPAGVIAEHTGSGKMMLVGCLVGAASLLLIVSGGSLWALTAGLVVLGLSQIMVSIATQLETILSATQANLARAITQYFFFSSASQIAGPVIGAALVGAKGYPAVFVGAAGLSLLGMLASWGAARRPPARDVVARPPAPWQTLVSTLAHRPGVRAALVVSLTAEFTMAFWSAFFPLLLVERGYGAQAVAFFFGLRAASNTGVRLVMGRITERVPRTRVLVVGMLVTAVSLGAMAVLRSHVAIGLAVLVFGFSMGLFTTLTAIAVAAGFAPEAAGVGVGMRMLAARVGLVLGPLVMGVVEESGGHIWAFAVGAAVCASPALLYLRRPRLSAVRRARAREEARH